MYKYLLRRVLTVLCCLAVVFGSVLSVSFLSSEEKSAPAAAESEIISDNVSFVQESSVCEEIKTDELRGIWIPCMSLQAGEDERSEGAYRKKISDIMEKCADFGFNTVIVQVRPFSDALYPSEYFPWSHIISGVQGESADFDPLQLMIEEAHSRKLAVHAWINPLRIKLGTTPDELSDDNPYVMWQKDEKHKDESFCFSCGDGLYYDPSAPQVRELIINGVRELAEKYDIDGLQIDDYFYPSDDTDYDSKSYEAYKKTVDKSCVPLSQQEWRKNNINMLIAGMSSALHSAKKGAVFGISPQGNFDNNEIMSADTKSWCSVPGYADYICPQLYVSMEHPVFPFVELAEKWREYADSSGTQLYLGLGLYKAGTDADGGTWLIKKNNIHDQIIYCREHGIRGFIVYSYEFLNEENAAEEVRAAADDIRAPVT